MKRMQPLTRSELLSVLRTAREQSVRDWALLLICHAHALRASECGELLLSRLNLKDWTLRIRRKKGSLDTLQRVQPNSEKLLDCRRALTEWLAIRPSDAGAHLFTSRDGGVLSRIQVYRLYRQYAEAAGLPDSKRGVNALKHTLGQRMADAGVDIKEMREAMGHKHLTATQAYFSITPAQADAARQIALTSRM